MKLFSRFLILFGVVNIAFAILSGFVMEGPRYPLLFEVVWVLGFFNIGSTSFGTGAILSYLSKKKGEVNE